MPRPTPTLAPVESPAGAALTVCVKVWIGEEVLNVLDIDIDEGDVVIEVELLDELLEAIDDALLVARVIVV